MKKLLLSLAAVACAASMSATTITLFDIANPGSWTGDGNGYTQTRTVDGIDVTITTNKASSTTNLLSPDNNTYAWRVYKSSSFTIKTPGFNMKRILITYDDFTSGTTNYTAEMDLSSGWTGTLNGVEYTLASAGLSELTATASKQQVRIKTIIASDTDDLGSTDPGTPENPGGGEDNPGGNTGGGVTGADGTYTIFDIANPGTWTGDGNGWTKTETIGDGTVTITTSKATSTTNLISPAANTYSWRVYKNSQFTITTSGLAMKRILITYDSDEYNGTGYISELDLSSGWTGYLNGAEYTLASNGLTTVTATASNQQVRIKKIEISDKDNIGSTDGSGNTGGDNGGDDVDVSSAISVAEALAKIADGFTGKALVKGYITSIDEINTSYGNATYYIADEKGGTPTLEVFRGYWLNGAKFTSEYQIQIGGLIYVEGDLVNYNGTYEFTSGSKVLKYTAPEGGDTPSLPEGVLYIGLTESIVGWDKVNDTTIGDFNGWKFQSATDNSPACAIANAYYGGSNHAANAKLQKEFDLTNAKNVSMSFEQAFGYYFPTQQDDFFRVYVICDGYTDYLTLRNFPAKGSGNWTGWETNEFDLSEYDGETIIIGFEYNNPGGSTSMAWELKNFYLYGEGSLSGIGAIEAESDAAPVYYNLQGVRVANPEKGLYIVVKGNKAEKVIF